MSRFAVLAAAAVLIAAACQPQTQGLTDADRAAIEEVTEQFLQAFLSADFETIAQLYTEDAVFLPPNEPAVTGREAIKTWLTAFPRVSAATFTTDEIDGVGDLAYVRGRYVMTLDLDASPVDSGKYVEIRKRQSDGTWRLVADIFNSSLRAPDTEQE